MGLTLFYGIIVAIPAVIIAGPLFSKTLKNIKSTPLQTFLPEYTPQEKQPSPLNSFFSALLPVLMIMFFSALTLTNIQNQYFTGIVSFTGNPNVVMLIALAVATYTLGLRQGKGMKEIMDHYGNAVKDISMILLIIAGAGALKQVFIDSGVSKDIAAHLQNLSISPLVLGWLVAAIIRVCVGSATVAGLTTASMIAPLIISTHANPNLMVLAVGAGSLMFSHVNDGGFWLFKEYFNITVKQTFLSWSLMETIVSVMGLAGALILNLFI
jgi:Gnt-I system high-affinity gluconate transporter